jgi:hypothetical protein
VRICIPHKYSTQLNYKFIAPTPINGREIEMAEVASDSSEWTDIEQYDGSWTDEPVKPGSSRQKPKAEPHSNDEKFLREADRVFKASEDEAKLFRYYYALEKRIKRETSRHEEFMSWWQDYGARTWEMRQYALELIDQSKRSKGSRDKGRVDIDAAEGR